MNTCKSIVYGTRRAAHDVPPLRHVYTPVNQQQEVYGVQHSTTSQSDGLFEIGPDFRQFLLAPQIWGPG